MWNELRLRNSRTFNAIRDTRHEHFTHAGRSDRIRDRHVPLCPAWQASSVCAGYVLGTVGLPGLVGILTTVRAVVLADTHAPRRWRRCPPIIARYLLRADLILHAGDVCTASVLDELSCYAPVRAVRGNNDGEDVAAWGAKETAELDLAGLPVAMIHDSGQSAGRCARLRRRFPTARLVVFGHSHIPADQAGDEVRIFNPGSPTDRRRQPRGTFGLLHIEDGQLLEARIVPVEA
jgi:putative phosphoesterase